MFLFGQSGFLRNRLAPGNSGAQPSRSTERRFLLFRGREIPYTLITNRLARNIRLKIDPSKGLEVVIPYRCRTESLETVLTDKAPWIIEKLDYQKEKKATGPKIADGEVISVLGIPKTIVIAPAVFTSVKETEESVIINLNRRILGGHESVARVLLAKHCRKIASTHIKKRTAEISALMGTSYGNITIRGQKTRWGSCSRDNNLNFNWKLVLMPSAAIDYVIIHELAHTVHHNHSSRFYALVEKYCPDYRSAKKILRVTQLPF